MTNTPHERIPGPAFEGGDISLPVPLTVETAAALADSVVDAARQLNGVELDFSEASLAQVDAILDEFHEIGSRATASATVAFGAYIGEVLVRNAGYRWRDTTAEERDLYGGWPMVVARDADQKVANPIGKAFKRVDNGPGEGVAFFYTVMAQS